MNILKTIFFLFVITFLFESCARKGSPSGGPKDEDPPIMVVAKPAYESLNFKGNKIRLYFNEYITLKDLDKQLVVSPPLKTQPLITPQGTPSKYINIKILDTLSKNTTYTFNFGDAIRDNNESNILKSFKYVFSTGNFIDSLTMAGSANDILVNGKSTNYNILLYKLDSTFNDSIIYKRKPNYVTKTLDSANYVFSNVAEGKYRVFALKEKVSNYLFNSKTDKIGFLLDTISLPKDSILSKPIVLFSEDQPYKFRRGKEVHKGKINFLFNGKQQNIKAELISKTPSDFKFFSKLDKSKDSLSFWYTPIKADSLNFIVTNSNRQDTTTVFLSKKRIDSLSVTTSVKGKYLHLLDTVFVTTNTPITKFDASKFSLISSDSIPVPFKIKELDFDKLAIFFDKKPLTKYDLRVLPKAIEDLYQVQLKDTLNYNFSTKDTEDYGTITLKVNKEIDAPVIIELSAKKEVIRRVVVKNSKEISFQLLEPNTYSLKAIIDDNNNGVWDTGSYLDKKQPERIVHYKNEDGKLILRANWILPVSMTISKNK